MPKLFRWVCPNCNVGTNAPSRLRKDDTRRYCLDCSANSKRLVMRTAPALVKRSAVKAEVAAKRRAIVADGKRLYYIVNGVDWGKELCKLAVLPVFGGRNGVPYTRVKNGLLKLVVHRCSRMPRTKLGHTDGRYEIHLYVYPGITSGSIRHTLLHELTHCIVRHVNGRHHHKGFFRKEKVALRQAERRFGPLEGEIIYKYRNRIVDQEDDDSEEGTEPGRTRGSDAAVLTGNQLAGLPAAA